MGWKKLTLKEHKQLGEKLGIIYTELLDIMMQLSHVYGTSKKQCKLAEKACKSIMEIRSTMDSVLDIDCPELRDSNKTYVYYSRNRKGNAYSMAECGEIIRRQLTWLKEIRENG